MMPHQPSASGKGRALEGIGRHPCAKGLDVAHGFSLKSRGIIATKRAGRCHEQSSIDLREL